MLILYLYINTVGDADVEKKSSLTNLQRPQIESSSGTTERGSLKAEQKFKEVDVMILEFKAYNFRDLISSQLDHQNFNFLERKNCYQSDMVGRWSANAGNIQVLFSEKYRQSYNKGNSQ